jgi:hypothetical protein
MRLRPDHQQQELFEEEEPPIALSFEQRLQLLPLVQAMLAEIVTVSADEEARDDQGRV